LTNGSLNKTSWESLIGVTTIPSVSTPSHNVVAIQNTVAGQKSNIAKVITENNGVLHTNLATSNTLLNA
jgi:hypothetical protein